MKTDRFRRRQWDAIARKDPLYGSYLAASAVRLVELNNGSITRDEVIKILKGQQMDNPEQFDIGMEYGKYSMLEANEIQVTIALCILKEIIVEECVSIICGEREVLSTGKGLDLFQTKINSLVYFGKDRNMAHWRDNDWGAFLEGASSRDIPDIASWRGYLRLLDRPNVFCEKKEKYIAFFSGAPEDIKEFIREGRTKYSGSQRRLYDELVEGMGRICKI